MTDIELQTWRDAKGLFHMTIGLFVLDRSLLFMVVRNEDEAFMISSLSGADRVARGCAELFLPYKFYKIVDPNDIGGCTWHGGLQVSVASMYTARRKIHKEKGVEPDDFEESVAQALFDLENTNQELKSELKDLFINSASQLDVSGNRKAIVIHVPYRLRKAFRKIHVRLVRELEKKFSGKDVVVIATRRILRPPKKGSAIVRPRSRTLTAVHEAILEDIVYPAEIVGKRVRYRLDGSKIMKIYLDPKERNNTEYKLDTFSGVYRKLAGKDVVFEYPISEAA